MIKQIPIFHNKCAGYLMYNGFVLQSMAKSKNSGDRQLNIYYFNDSEELKKSIDKFRELHKK